MFCRPSDATNQLSAAAMESCFLENWRVMVSAITRVTHKPISRAAGFVRKWQRTVLLTCGYWEQNVGDRLRKIEFMQWKNVDCPTFTEICNWTINWLDFGNSFSGIQTDCLWQTTCILKRQLLVSIMQNQHSIKLLDVIKQKHWRKLSYRSLTFSW